MTGQTGHHDELGTSNTRTRSILNHPRSTNLSESEFVTFSQIKGIIQNVIFGFDPPESQPHASSKSTIRRGRKASSKKKKNGEGRGEKAIDSFAKDMFLVTNGLR
jgi:hypothetical protein